MLSKALIVAEVWTACLKPSLINLIFALQVNNCWLKNKIRVRKSFIWSTKKKTYECPVISCKSKKLGLPKFLEKVNNFF